MGFIIFVVIVGVIIYNVVNNNKSGQEQWRAAAERLGLGYYAEGFGGGGKISGRKGGHRVEISTYTRGSGNSAKSYTKYRVDYHERIRVDFRMGRQSPYMVTGEQEVVVGNASFDKEVTVTGMYPDAVKKFLTPARQQAVLDLLKKHSNAQITNQFIEVDKSGKELDSAVIYATARRLLSLCNDLTDESGCIADKVKQEKKPEPPPVPVFEPVEPAYDQFSIPNPVVPDPPDISVDEDIEVEIDPAVDDIVCPSGFDLEQVTICEEEPSEEYDEEPAFAEERMDEPFEIQVVAEDLFGGSSTSVLTASRVFDEKYLGKEVKGTGELKRVGKFSYDAVFKNTTGVKATVVVCELEGAYSKVRITAEVKFDVDQYSQLKERVGSTFSVKGTMIAADSMLHQLYIES